MTHNVVLTHELRLPMLRPMKPELATQVRLTGLVRSPEREGALAYLDSDRGFALVSRGAMSFADVIDPTIWVREKLALALASRSDSGEPSLRRLIGALRAIHAELVARPQSARTWVAVLALLVSEGEGVVLLAGDCPCYRFRDGRLSRLGRAGVESAGGDPPAGALGSETRVRIEVVPLHPEPGECYILCTDPLREGEVAVLARELEEARDDETLVRRGIAGAPDKGWVAVRVVAGAESADASADAGLPPSAEYRWGGPLEPDALAPAAAESLEIEPLGPLEPAASEPRHPETTEERPAVQEPPIEPDSGIASGTEAGPERPIPAPDGAGPKRARTLATLEDERPWYEPFALWGGGALAIIALALLVRSILPGLIGSPRGPGSPAGLAAPGAVGHIDIYSDPADARIRIDGVALDRRTPAVGLSVAPGRRRVELDWGAFGTWRDSVEVTAGAHLVLRPRVFGAAAFRSSDPSRSLDVYVDGTYAGSTPLALDTLAVGKHLVRFGGPGLQTVAQDIEVFPNARVELVGNAGPLPETGKLTVRAATLGDTGFEPSRGDPVWVDGEPRGLTPLTLQLKPGAHSARVARRGYPPQVTVLEIKAGGEQFVTAEFGARSEEPLRFTPPSSLSVRNPLPVTIALPESEWDATMALWVYAASPQGSFQARRMTALDERARTYAALIPPEVMRNETRKVRVYFKATGAAGRELYSEIYTIPVSE